MRLSICGTDERSMCLKTLAQQKGYIITEHTPDAVVLPLPRAKLGDVKRLYREGQKVILGYGDDALMEVAGKYGWQMQSLFDDAEYQMENAWLTAEGAVYLAMKKLCRTLYRANCLVVGYGRIGKALTRMLRGIGAEVTVAARREEARKKAGENSIAIEGIKECISSMDFIFNTVPSPVMGKRELTLVRKEAVLMELASAPYGVDMEAALEAGVQVQIEGGIPGRYCPMQAAQAWLEGIERSVLL